MAEIREQEYAVDVRGDFYDRHDGRQAILFRPEGIVVVWIGLLLRGLQHVDFETVIGGRTYRMTQRRPPSEFLTEQGAKRVASRWLRDVAARTQEDEWESEGRDELVEALEKYDYGRIADPRAVRLMKEAAARLRSQESEPSGAVSPR